MAYDIGPRIGIDGYADFKKSIESINEDVKGLTSELKLVAATYDENGDSMEALQKKNEVLQKTYDTHTKKIEEVEKLLEAAKKEYDENSTEVKKWERVLTDSKTALQNTKNEMEKNCHAMEELENSTDGATKATEKLADSTEKTSGKFGALTTAAGNLISGGLSKVVDGVESVVSTLVGLDETTEEYRTAMGTLNTAFETAGYGSDTAKTAYEGLYAVLGDTDTAVETAQLMAQLAEHEEDMAEWTDIAAGVAGTFGDALPINSLIEASNETAKVGKVTGALADALNWVGISEDDFNEKLEDCTTESERNQLIMDTLGDTYLDAADAFYQNNEELIRSRENQAKLDEVTGRLGESVAGVKNTLIEKFAPALADVGEKAADFIDNIDTDKLFKKFDEAVDGISHAFSDGWDFITGIYDAAPNFFDTIADNVGNAFTIVKDLWHGDFEAAYDDVLTGVTNTVASFTEIGAGIWDLFDGMDKEWSFDFNTAAESIKTAATNLWSNVKNVFSDIKDAISDGVDKGLDNYEADKIAGLPTDTQHKDSAWYDANRSAVYLDGKKVGKVLNNGYTVSEVRVSGYDVNLLP